MATTDSEGELIDAFKNLSHKEADTDSTTEAGSKPVSKSRRERRQKAKAKSKASSSNEQAVESESMSFEHDDRQVVKRLAHIALHAKIQLADLMKAHGHDYDDEKDVDLDYVTEVIEALNNDGEFECDSNFVSELGTDEEPDKDPTRQTNTLWIAEPWQLNVDDDTTIYDLLQSGIDLKTLMRSSAWQVLQANSRRAHAAHSLRQQQQFESSDSDPEIHIGSWVEIHGLTSASGQSLNGIIGEVVTEGERIGVHIHEEDRSVSIQRINLTVVGSSRECDGEWE